MRAACMSTAEMTMTQAAERIELSWATIDYEDTGGPGPTIPLGSHRTPVRDRAALTPTGVADLIAELMERLELSDVTIVANDTGGAITQLLLTRRPERIARVVLTPCDAFENFLPPAFRPLQWLAK